MWGPYPIGERMREQRAAKFLRVVARLKENASVEGANAEAGVLRRRLAEQHPRFYGNVELGVIPIDDALLGSVRRPILILLAAIALVALIGCANVSNLLVARAAERTLEFRIRTAIGAAPRHLAAQLIAESSVLAALGTAPVCRSRLRSSAGWWPRRQERYLGSTTRR
jgi:hypothetical protein